MIEQAAHAVLAARPAWRITRYARVIASSTSDIGFTMGRNADRKR
jgi:hypothetical protein